MRTLAGKSLGPWRRHRNGRRWEQAWVNLARETWRRGTETWPRRVVAGIIATAGSRREDPDEDATYLAPCFPGALARPLPPPRHMFLFSYRPSQCLGTTDGASCVAACPPSDPHARVLGGTFPSPKVKNKLSVEPSALLVIAHLMAPHNVGATLARPQCLLETHQLR